MADEVIRQVTVNCAERGLLLLRVRDELRMSMLAYQSLLESSIAYGRVFSRVFKTEALNLGLRKALVVEEEQSKAVIERDEERAKNRELLEKVVERGI